MEKEIQPKAGQTWKSIKGGDEFKIYGESFRKPKKEYYCLSTDGKRKFSLYPDAFYVGLYELVK